MEGECTVGYIEISDRLPIYGSEKDYMKTHGVNGWNYLIHNNGITYREMVWNEQRELWNAANDGELIVTPNVQTSKNYMGTVRRWICPADGKYKVKYNFKQIAPNGIPDKDHLTSLILRRNHKTIEKDIYDQKSGVLAGFHEKEMTLETGEALSFEFYNANEKTTEIIEIAISIEKCEYDGMKIHTEAGGLYISGAKYRLFRKKR